MKINIFGSTGNIGCKTLDLINNFFPKIKVNLLVSNNNYKKLISQSKKYKPRYVFINNKKYIFKLKDELKKYNIKILEQDDLIVYLNNSKSDLTLLSISGFDSLNYFENIINNTKILGLVSKECIVSAGHLFKNIIKSKKVKFFPLDSEHFSLFNYFKNPKLAIPYHKIYLTASGGPFLNTKRSDFKNIQFKQAIKHPKWKMGYKNSIDSSTMANKCLEIIEAKYLFDISFSDIDILIHPESLVHSIVEHKNFTSSFNYFYNDMRIPIFNFLNYSYYPKKNYVNNKYLIKNKFKFNFMPINLKQFPIYKTFLKLNKNSPKNLIKFNCANEYAVELFKSQIIRFDEINQIINKCLLINIDYPVNNINNIIKYQKICIEKFNEYKNNYN